MTFERTTVPNRHGATMGGTHTYGPAINHAHDQCRPQFVDGVRVPGRCWSPVWGDQVPCVECGELVK